MTGIISDIKRFAVHDGDGIRTTVFFKGCPLRCVWCHNPEGLESKPQTAYYSEKCINCGECITVCPQKAHKFTDGIHIFDRELCIGCGKCEKVCLGNALQFYGSQTTVEELLPILLQDKEFYENSGGGVTLSGGECLIYPDFCAELLKALKKEGIHTAVDTSGFVQRASFEKVMDYTDIFLYDIKSITESTHIKCTGKSNKIILENIKYIDSCGKKTEIRVPFIPNFNDTEMGKIAEFIKSLKNVTAVKLLPYHNYAGSKYLSLGLKNSLPEVLPQNGQIETAKNIFLKYGINIK